MALVAPEVADLISPINLATWHSGGQYRRARHLELLEREFLETIQPGGWDVLVAQAPPRHGKLLAHGTPIWTPAGWRSHGDLQPGDYVYSPSGLPVRVLAIGGDGVADRRMVFNDGTFIDCHHAHEWWVSDRARRGRGQFVVESQEIQASPYMGQGRNGEPRARYMINYCEPLEGAHCELPVDPYVMGVWLGDGRASAPDICGELFDLTAIEAVIASRGYELGWQSVHADTGVCYRGIRGLWKGLKLAGVANQKHIPKQYLIASEEQRRDLLAGLVDSDGSVEPGGRVRFVSVSWRLCHDVAMLVRTLGYRASVNSQNPTLSSSGIQGRQMVYTVQWSPHDGKPQGYLPRKRGTGGCVRRRFSVQQVVTLPPGESLPGRCIQVEGGLYLAGESLIPTHNSEFLSRWVPSWWHSVYPESPSIVTSHSMSLARNHSRWVRDRVRQLSRFYQNGGVSRTAASATDWLMDRGGGMVAAGVGGSIIGRGAKLFIIDDFLKNAEQAVSERIRNAQWEWFQTTAFTRLEPGGKLVILACLTGDTPVAVPGGEVPIRDIRKGDLVKTFRDGKLSVASVVNSARVGHDDVFSVVMRSGRVVRGNARHPFLVVGEKGLEWVRLQNLTVGQKILATRPGVVSGASRNSTQRARRARARFTRGGCASGTTSGSCRVGRRESNGRTEIASTTARRVGGRRRVTTPRAMHARKSQSFTGSVCSIVTASSGGRASERIRPKGRGRRSSSIGMELRSRSSTRRTIARVGGVRSVANCQFPGTIYRKAGLPSCASTTATNRGRSVGCSAINAIWLPETLEAPSVPLSSLDTSSYTNDEIVAIDPAGREDVYDIEVEETGNFVANGLVTHNTRWHSDDLIGRILKHTLEETSLRVREIRLPALAEPTEASPDPLGREADEPLWPSQWSYEQLARIRDALDDYWWAAVYQQRLGTYGKNEWPEEYFYGIFAQEDEWPENMPVSAVALDPSKGKSSKKGDYSAIVYVGYQDGRLWVEADLDRRPVPKMMRDLVDFVDRTRPMVVGIEGVAFQELLATDFILAQEETGGRRDDPVLIDNTVPKSMRIGRLGTWLRKHQIKIRRNAGGQMLLDQLKEFPNAAHDDGCFASGTPVTMADGKTKPIETIQAGDLVASRKGPARVLKAGCTGVRPVVEYSCPDGLKLVATPGHPIYAGDGFVPISQATKVYVCPGEFSASSRLSMAASSSVVTQKPRHRVTGITSRRDPRTSSVAWKRYIGKFGKLSGVRSRPDGMCIIGTGITATTRSKISSAFRLRSTRSGIGRSNLSGLGLRGSTPRLESGRLRGMVAKPAGRGTRSTRGGSRQVGSRSRAAVNSAVSPIKAKIRRGRSSAGRGVGSESMRLIELPVVASRILGPVPVFNLTTETGEYFAGGVAVHNCDALEMALRLVIRLGDDLLQGGSGDIPEQLNATGGW